MVFVDNLRNYSYICFEDAMAIQLPTGAELEILNVLWRRGASTVREVYEAISSTSAIGYTTILKQLQIMLDKGLVRRDDARRSHVYRAAIPAESTQRKMVVDLMERAFSGSASQLVQRALSAQRASAAELREIRQLLDRIEGREKDR
jgi:BlaI family transcriptional regulator, penicillinase repressor